MLFPGVLKMEKIEIDLDEDGEDDIFIVEEIKPVINLTVSEALLIKHKVLSSFKSKTNSPSKGVKRKKLKPKEKHKEKVSKKNSFEVLRNASFDQSTQLNNSVSSTPESIVNEKSSNKKKFNTSSESHLKYSMSDKTNSIIMSTLDCKKKLIEQISELKSAEFEDECESAESVSEEMSHQQMDYELSENKKEIIQLSPGIAKRKKKYRLSSTISPSKSQSPKKQIFVKNGFSPTKPKITSTPTSPQIKAKMNEKLNFEVPPWLDKTTTGEPVVESLIKKEQESFDDNGNLLGFLLKKIISDVTKRQLNLEGQYLKEGKVLEKLFSVHECDILEEFCKLEGVHCKVFVRLLSRSRDWYRVSTIHFKDVDVPLDNIIHELSNLNLLDKSIEQEDLKTQMSLLQKPEILKLCKHFLTSVKINKSGKKMDLIQSLIDNSQSQKSVMNMFKKDNGPSTLIQRLQSEVSKALGSCFRINETAKATFHKVVILFSFAHYFDEEEKRIRHQLYMCMNVHKNQIAFPKYKLAPTVVFETCDDFEHYTTALNLAEELSLAIESKNYENFISISQKVKEEFKKLLINDKYIERYNKLKPFLKRFSGGHIYAKLLTKFCTKFKTKTKANEIIGMVQMLLAQNLFLSSKRGKWYEILAQKLESVKDNKAAAEVLIKAQSDPYVDEVQKLILQLRGQMMLKKKKSGIEEKYLREMLDDVCTISVQEPASIEITGKALEGNQSGFKTVYLEKTACGKMFTSVEERAILHYKGNGFSKGCHVEGFIIQTLYGLLFFDIIYGSSPTGVFQSSYQETPLDLYSKHFYLNRKDALDQRLIEMSDWTEEEAEHKLKSAYYQNMNLICIITWKEHFTPDLLCEIMKCITIPILAKICRRLVMDYRLAKSGFPDLTLWNPETKKCKFVEVKSPNDKLSSGQRIWLDFLRQIGVDCEVCNVKNVSRKLAL